MRKGQERGYRGWELAELEADHLASRGRLCTSHCLEASCLMVNTWRMAPSPPSPLCAHTSVESQSGTSYRESFSRPESTFPKYHSQSQRVELFQEVQARKPERKMFALRTLDFIPRTKVRDLLSMTAESLPKGTKLEWRLSLGSSHGHRCQVGKGARQTVPGSSYLICLLLPIAKSVLLCVPCGW